MASLIFWKLCDAILTIAQPFMAGFTIEKHQKSREGRKVLADGHHVLCRPSRDFYLGLTPTSALKGWAIVSGMIPFFCKLAAKTGSFVKIFPLFVKWRGCS